MTTLTPSQLASQAESSIEGIDIEAASIQERIIALKQELLVLAQQRARYSKQANDYYSSGQHQNG